LDWNTLPDLLALSALVAVFFSLLPRRADTTLRLWLAAWVFILIHFAAKFCDGPGTNNPIEFVVFGALDLSGLTFMWAAASPKIGRREWVVFASFAIPQLIFFGMSIFASPSHAQYAVAAVAGIVVPAIALTFAVPSVRDRIAAIASCLVLGLSMLLIIYYTPDPTNGVSAVLAWLYLNAAFLHLRRFPRPTTGIVTTVAGLFVWSLVFPIYLVLPIWAPHIRIDSVAYNIPKYVVAIGIILMLLEEQMERSTFLAKHDDLTGLPNRRMLGERLEASLQRAKRGQHKVALLTIDLDDFKAVNDSLGHSAGDEFLRIIARRLSDRVRLIDTCARLGGDEFIVIAEQLSHRGDGDVVARDLLATLDEPIELCGQHIRASASIGVAMYPDDATDTEGLYGISDSRMYSVKERNHDRQSFSVRRSAS
jgi:diguanylate cyclase (GGDEF)-like protein